MKIKTTVEYQYISTKISKILKPDRVMCWQGCGATETLITAAGNVKWHNHFGKN